MALISTLAGILGGTAASGTAAGTLASGLSTIGSAIGGPTGASLGASLGSGISSAGGAVGSAIGSVLPEAVTSTIAGIPETIASVIPEAVTSAIPEVSLSGIQEGGLSGLLDSVGLETMGKGVGDLAGGLGKLDALISTGSDAVLNPIASGFESGLETIGLDQPLSALGDKLGSFGQGATEQINSAFPQPVQPQLGDTFTTRLSNLPNNLSTGLRDTLTSPFQDVSGLGNSLATPQGRIGGMQNYMNNSAMGQVNQGVDQGLNQIGQPNAGALQQQQQQMQQRRADRERKRMELAMQTGGGLLQ